MLFFRHLKEVTTASPEAYRYYVQGLDLQRRNQQREAVSLFEKAIAIDTNFALAFVKLAAIDNNLGHPVLTEKYGQRAMDLTSRRTARAILHRGHLLLAEGSDDAEGHRRLQEFPRALSNDDQAKHSLAVTYNRLDMQGEAIRFGEELRQRGVSTPLRGTTSPSTIPRLVSSTRRGR